MHMHKILRVYDTGFIFSIRADLMLPNIYTVFLKLLQNKIARRVSRKKKRASAIVFLVRFNSENSTLLFVQGRFVLKLNASATQTFFSFSFLLLEKYPTLIIRIHSQMITQNSVLIK